MNAGLLTEKIDILRKRIRINEYSEEVEEWFNRCTTRAALKHKAGKVTNENNEITPTYTLEFTVWYYVDVDDYDRIRWNNKLYSVVNIIPNKENNNKNITVELVNE